MISVNKSANLPFSSQKSVIVWDTEEKLDFECLHQSANLLQLFSSVQGARKESVVLCYTPKCTPATRLVELDQLVTLVKIVGNGLLAQYMLASRNRLLNKIELRYNGQGNDDCFDVGPGQQVVDGTARRGRSVKVGIDVFFRSE